MIITKELVSQVMFAETGCLIKSDEINVAEYIVITTIMTLYELDDMEYHEFHRNMLRETNSIMLKRGFISSPISEEDAYKHVSRMGFHPN